VVILFLSLGFHGLLTVNVWRGRLLERHQLMVIEGYINHHQPSTEKRQ
jgi:hypothetical protein